MFIWLKQILHKILHTITIIQNFKIKSWDWFLIYTHWGIFTGTTHCIYTYTYVLHAIIHNYDWFNILHDSDAREVAWDFEFIRANDFLNMSVSTLVCSKDWNSLYFANNAPKFCTIWIIYDFKNKIVLMIGLVKK